MGCLPVEFTFVGEGGNGSGGGTGAGVPSTCGNAVIDEGEECDAGEANADDLDDASSAAVADGQGPIGCTKACRHAVAWSRTVELDDQSMYFGLELEGGNVIAGGSHLNETTSEAIVPLKLRYTARRVVRSYSPDGALAFEIVDPSDNPQGEQYGVIGMTRMSAGLLYLEVYERSAPEFDPAHHGSSLFGMSGNVPLFAPVELASEDYYAAVGPSGTGQGALAVGYDVGSVHVWAVDENGTFGEVGLDSGAVLSGTPAEIGYGPGAVTGYLDGVLFAWRRYVMRVASNGALLQVHELDGHDITSLCLSDNDTIVAGTWDLTGARPSAKVVWLDPSLTVLDEAVVAGGPTAAGVNDVACGPNGEVVAVGEEALQGDNLPSDASRVFVTKLGAKRDVLWTRRHTGYVAPNGSSDSDAYAVALDADGAVYVAGREMSKSTISSAWLRRYGP